MYRAIVVYGGVLLLLVLLFLLDRSDTGLIYLAIAYGGFFIVLAGFLSFIVKRDSELQATVDALEARAAAGAKKD